MTKSLPERYVIGCNAGLYRTGAGVTGPSLSDLRLSLGVVLNRCQVHSVIGAAPHQKAVVWGRQLP